VLTRHFEKRAKQYCSKSQMRPYKDKRLVPHNQSQNTRLGEIIIILRCIQGCMVVSLHGTEATQEAVRLGLLFLQLTLHRPAKQFHGVGHNTASQNNAAANTYNTRDYSTVTEGLVSTTGISLYTYTEL